jgi:hypothetical protein
MQKRTINHSRRRAIKLVAYTTITLPFIGILNGVYGIEELPTVTTQDMTREVTRGYVIEIYRPQALAANATGLASNAINQETLLIDGEIIPYIQDAYGYHVYYQPPQNSLIKAARNFIETQREK